MFIEQNERIEGASAYPKANLLNRSIAKFLDVLLVAALHEIPLQVSFVVGMAYLSIADGFFGGSAGKRLIGLKTVVWEGQREVSFRESIIRNIPFIVAYLVYHVPFIGWFIALGIAGFEFFLMLGNPNGIRLGDELAKTFVLDIRATDTQIGQTGKHQTPSHPGIVPPVENRLGGTAPILGTVPLAHPWGSDENSPQTPVDGVGL